MSILCQGIYSLFRYAIVPIAVCCALAAGTDDAFAAGPPVVTAAQRQFVTQALEAVLPENPDTFETAENLLVSQGVKIVPALRETLVHVQGVQHDVLDGALVRLIWKIDPRERVTQWLANETHQDATVWRREHRPLPISDETVITVFPGHRFYTVHFRMYPVARLAPAPLKDQNLFAVSKTGEITHMTEPEALKRFFQTALPPINSGGVKAYKDVVYVWLRLSQEFSWDGFFQFTIPKETLAVAKTGRGCEASGIAPVTPKGGNRGKIDAMLSFDLRGRLTGVQEARNIQAGARPICQATRLLDPDPLVRAMAEQALLVMGISARDYLAERRALAAPKLKDAIDRIWQRIVERERAMGGAAPLLDLKVDR